MSAESDSPSGPMFPTWAKWLVGMICFLCALPFLFHTVENYRGKQAWDETVVWLEEQGYSLEHEPPPLPKIPDEENYWKQPFVRSIMPDRYDEEDEPIYDFSYEKAQLDSYGLSAFKIQQPLPALISRRNRNTSDIASVAEWMSPVLDTDDAKSEDLATRVLHFIQEKFPEETKQLGHAAVLSRGEAPYHFAEDPIQRKYQKIPFLKDLYRIFAMEQLRFFVAVEAKEAGIAWEAFVFPTQAAAFQSSDPSLNLLYHQNSWRIMTIDMLWLALDRQIFNRGKLDHLQAGLNDLDPISHLREISKSNTLYITIPFLQAMGENPDSRGQYRDITERLPRTTPVADSVISKIGIPRGYFDFNQSLVVRDVFEKVAPRLDAQWIGDLSIQTRSNPTDSSYIDFYAAVERNIARSIATRVARFTIDLEQAKIAVALERFHLANGAYPKDLSELVPPYLPSIPEDPFAEHPMKYRLSENGRPVIYSVGPDGTDELGKTLTGDDRFHPTRSRGDISWHYSKDLLIED